MDEPGNADPGRSFGFYTNPVVVGISGPRGYLQASRIPAIASRSAGVTHSWYLAFTAV